MTTDIALRRPEIVRLDTDQIQYLAHTEFVPERIRGNLPAIFATIAAGREIGIGDMASLQHIQIIDGKPSPSAQILCAVVRRDGHSITGETSSTSATAIGTRDNGDTMTVTWTIEMAQRVQTRVKGGGKIPLADKEAWQNYPESMLWARAVSQLCRMLFPDCTAGFTYTPEELGGAETVDMSDPDIPFGDAPQPALQPPASAAQKKKLNVLVGQLRPDRLSTEKLWAIVGRTPLAEHHAGDGRLCWSPLRDSLTKVEASKLIETLGLLSSSGEPQPASDMRGEASAGISDPQAAAGTVAQAGEDEPASPDDILALSARLIGASSDPQAAAYAIERKAATQSPAEHLAWLRGQEKKQFAAARGGDAE